MERVGDYKICNRHGPYSEPSCQLCQDEMNQRFRRAADRVSQKHTGKAEDTMKQPTPEQLNDPDWWEENCDPDTKTIAVITDARGGLRGVQELPWESWGAIELEHPDDDFTLHPRPTNPSAPEWDGKGWPPAECECEFKTTPREGQGNFADDWENCIVKYASDNGCFLLDEDRSECFMDSMDYNIEFRPIRTQADIERETLEYFIRTAYDEGGLKGVAQDLLTYFDIEPKEGD